MKSSLKRAKVGKKKKKRSDESNPSLTLLHTTLIFVLSNFSFLTFYTYNVYPEGLILPIQREFADIHPPKEGVIQFPTITREINTKLLPHPKIQFLRLRRLSKSVIMN